MSGKTSQISITKIRYIIIMFKITAFFIITLCTRLYMRVGILITCGKHLHDRIISLSGGLSSCNYCSPGTFHWSVCTKPGKWAIWCICVNVYGICLYLRCCILDFGIVLIVRYFLFFLLLFYMVDMYDNICFVLINSSLTLYFLACIN